MASYKVSPITCPLHLAKGPHWDAASETLYCVDIFKGTVHSYKPSTCQFSTATVGDGKSAMAVIVPVAGEKNKFLVSMKNDVSTICWNGLSEKTSKPEIVASAEPAANHNRLNNGKVDPCGRLWAGTTGRRLHPTELEFEEDVGSLYCFEKGGNVSKKLDNITISNGLEWSEDCKKFFYVDSYRYNVMAYDYDNATGNICNGKEIFKTKENGVPGLLDAMAIDTAGRLYIANYVGCQVVVIDSHTGKLVQKIPIPAEEVTSCAFGGPNLDILYVTTGNTNPNAQHPIAGRIFQVTGLGAKGYAGRSVVLNDVKVERVSNIPLKHRTSLSWNANEQTLFYTDYASAKIHSYKPSSKTLNTTNIPKGEGSAILLPIVGRKESFLIGQRNSIARVRWDGLSSSSTSVPEILATLQHEKKENTIISGKVDRHGQIWIGTSSKYVATNNLDTSNSQGNVYQLSNNCRETTKQLENVGFPSDFEWSADGRVMYCIDSTKQIVEAFDLNPRTGLLASFNSRKVFSMKDTENPGFITSLTIDKNNRLYLSIRPLGQVLVINPENGDLLNRIKIPDSEVVACTFGGINMDVLFVITSNSMEESNNSGKLFQIFNLGCQGYPAAGALLDVSLKVEHLMGGLNQPRGIRWNVENASVQFADSTRATIHNFCSLSNTLSTASISQDGEMAGLILPIAGQKDVYAISMGMDVLIAKWDNHSSDISSPVILTKLSNYEEFNNSGKSWICCGNVDQRGNLWAGTTEKHPDKIKDSSNQNIGHIYCVQKGHQVIKKLVDLSLPSGFVWSENGQKLFYVDSFQFTIQVCDYNEDSGVLSNCKELFYLLDHKIPGFLSGITIDTNGMLYAANYFGGQVLVIDSITGKLFRTIKIPSSEVVDCTFGGHKMDTLFVLTASSESKQNGSLYKVTNIGARGYPPRSIIMENSLRTEPVTPALTYGKGAFWDEDEQLLYFCDPSQGTVHSYNPVTSRFVTAKVVGAEKSNTNIIIPLRGLRYKFLLGLDNELCVVHWDGKSSETSAPEKSIFIDKKTGNRFNTGKIDSRGRLWAGTTSTESSDLLLQGGEGSLYYLDRFRIVEKFSAVAKVSGIEWSSDRKRLFLIDTIKSRVESYDYDEKSGSVSNGKVIYKLAQLKRGILYSMTIDMNNTLYVCNNYGNQILMIDSESGELLRTLSIPATEILSCAFGGPYLDTLYVTTGNSNPSLDFPKAGSVFAITNLGVRGVPSRKLIIDESIRADPVTNAFSFAAGPHWDADKQRLYFVAKKGTTPLFCSYSPATSRTISAIVGNGTHTPAMLIPVTNQKDAFIVSISNQLAIVTWDGVSQRTSEPCFIADCDLEQNSKRLSVGKVDPQGRLWSGATCNKFSSNTVENFEIAFQNEEKNENSIKNVEQTAFSNGLEWSADSKKFYYVDSLKLDVNSFDFDPPSGIISNKKCIFKLEDHNLSGSLDAITIDIDGNLYISNNMGSQILVINPESGTLVSKIPIPAAEVTGCAFGGTNLDILYVTTGQNGAQSQPHAGKIFHVKHLGVHGLPGRNLKL